MREIKFRAWVEEPGTDIRWFYYFKIGETVSPSLSVVAWEQFTGLHDKNGKEIYEGDILENPDYEEAFVVEYHEGVAGYVGWGDDKTAGCYLITGDEIEVIGNIYER